MRKICILLFFLLWSVIGQAAFVPGTEDVPAMDDMIFSDDIVSFDVPEGQILVIIGTTSSSVQTINNFYQESLNALGWQLIKSGSYIRGKDHLDIVVSGGKTKNEVKFNLTIFNN